MKLAIVGGRDFTNYELLCEKIENLQIDEIVSGGAKGADTLAKRYAEEHNIPYIEFPADWKKHKKAAGPIRNSEIVNYCDKLIACWDGKSKGTSDSITKANRLNKFLFVILY